MSTTVQAAVEVEHHLETITKSMVSAERAEQIPVEPVAVGQV